MLLNLDSKFKPMGFNNNEIPAVVMQFPGGEEHVKLEDVPSLVTHVTVTHRLTSSTRVMQLLLAVDALRNKYGRNVIIDAILPYLPYARQDRVMVPGEPFSLGVIVDILKLCRFNQISVLDPHSDVANALLRQEMQNPLFPFYLVNTYQQIKEKVGDNLVVLSPDGGALKKVFKHCKIVGFQGKVFDATKMRNLATGQIIHTQINAQPADIEGKAVWIMDDLCSYGGTFKALAVELRKMGAAEIYLSVSHYEGVASTAELALSGINKVYTTNSMVDVPENDQDFVIQFPI